MGGSTPAASLRASAQRPVKASVTREVKQKLDWTSAPEDKQIFTKPSTYQRLYFCCEAYIEPALQNYRARLLEYYVEASKGTAHNLNCRVWTAYLPVLCACIGAKCAIILAEEGLASGMKFYILYAHAFTLMPSRTSAPTEHVVSPPLPPPSRWYVCALVRMWTWSTIFALHTAAVLDVYKYHALHVCMDVQFYITCKYWESWNLSLYSDVVIAHFCIIEHLIT